MIFRMQTIRILTACLGLSLLLLTGCSSISVNYDYDTSTNFGSLRSYSWAPDPETALTQMDAARADRRSGLLSNRIKTSVNKNLTAKGLILNDDTPDLLAVFHIGVQDKIQVTNWGYNYSNYYWGGGYGGQQMDVYQYQEGQLIIDLVDAKSHNLVWRGSGSGVVDNTNRSPEEMQARMDDIVAQILANFPPPVK
jgi:Domain of unknown function (DUF4136)